MRGLSSLERKLLLECLGEPNEEPFDVEEHGQAFELCEALHRRERARQARPLLLHDRRGKDPGMNVQELSARRRS